MTLMMMEVEVVEVVVVVMKMTNNQNNTHEILPPLPYRTALSQHACKRNPP